MCRVFVVFVTLTVGVTAAEPPDAVTFSVEVNLGPDHGQSFGSLFEARDASGRVVAGAGFQDVYNTRFRSDRHMLQFYVRPAAGVHEFEIERLPHPDLDCGVYLFDHNEDLFAWSSVRNNSVRRWDATARVWVEPGPDMPPIRSGDGIMRVGGGTLVFSNDTATYDGHTILTPPERGGYFNFYYALGHLFFYHRIRDDKKSSTHIHACPWTSESTSAIDVNDAAVLRTKYEQETPFAWGQWEDQVLTVSNMGGIYVFEDGAWRTILAPDNTVSYQVYSGLHWRDRLLLAQYPTGNIFEYQGSNARHLADWPPRMPGVARNARECQTLGIYRGDLFAGVWPWAELWRFDGNDSQWQFLDRLFTHPEITDERTHPYEPEADQYGLVTNHWGQRVTGMIPLGDAMYLSTSSKGTSEWNERYEFLSEDQRREYGAVLRLRMAGNLAAQVRWTDGPTRLDFALTTDGLSMSQDGELLATAPIPDIPIESNDLTVNWGQGVFGPLQGELTNQQFSIQP